MINTEWESNVTYNRERTVQKIYRFKKRGKADRKMVIHEQNESLVRHILIMLKLSYCLQDFADEAKYGYEEKPMLHKKLLSQYPNFTQKH